MTEDERLHFADESRLDRECRVECAKIAARALCEAARILVPESVPLDSEPDVTSEAPPNTTADADPHAFTCTNCGEHERTESKGGRFFCANIHCRFAALSSGGFVGWRDVA